MDQRRKTIIEDQLKLRNDRVERESQTILDDWQSWKTGDQEVIRAPHAKSIFLCPRYVNRKTSTTIKTEAIALGLTIEPREDDGFLVVDKILQESLGNIWKIFNVVK